METNNTINAPAILAAPYSRAAVELLRGVVYDDQKETWANLVEYENELREYFKVLQLEIFKDDREGYAFLYDARKETDENDSLPTLVDTRKMSYMQTLLLVFLRKEMLQEDAKGGATKVTIKKERIIQQMQLFFPQGTNQVKERHRIEKAINAIVKLKFLKELGKDGDEYEIRKIIKARITAEELAEVEARLKTYAHVRD